ncbi:hypothetical protein KUTeg_008887 [Tegillarca granosa]|uniref:Uncharacterized protein n=1 Tax=Tegillarca granosa TaxID=220873 RepID=A0ABQ9FCI8_TEGGR|nr:hypothetical protein KUTeg_008887 [Tegillarca granosa]
MVETLSNGTRNKNNGEIMGCSASKIDNAYRVLLLGIDGSGSTKLLFQLTFGQEVTTIPTIGFNVENIRYKSETFTVWDIGAVIFAVDSTDRDRFPEALAALMGLLEQPDLKGVPLIVLANKQDIEGAAKKDEVMLALQLIYMQNREWYIVETSAITRQGFAEFLDLLVAVCTNKGRK